MLIGRIEMKIIVSSLFYLSSLCLCVFVVFSLLPFSKTTASNTELLEQGRTIERSLKGGEIDSFDIKLTSGQFLYAVAEQRGIDLILVLLSPENREVTETDSPNGNLGYEPVYWIAEEAGIYHLQVRALDKETSGGSYH